EFVALGEHAPLDPVAHFLRGEVTVLIGQSGVGKSTLLNSMNASLDIETGEISQSLGRGRHTTRHVELIPLHDGLVADTPGFSSLDFTHVEAEELSNYFREMRPLRKQCKFRQCLHRREPHCAIKQAVEDQEIQRYRYEHYVQFLQEI